MGIVEEIKAAVAVKKRQRYEEGFEFYENIDELHTMSFEPRNSMSYFEVDSPLNIAAQERFREIREQFGDDNVLIAEAYPKATPGQVGVYVRKEHKPREFILWNDGLWTEPPYSTKDSAGRLDGATLCVVPADTQNLNCRAELEKLRTALQAKANEGQAVLIEHYHGGEEERIQQMQEWLGELVDLLKPKGS